MEHKLELETIILAWRDATWRQEFPSGRLPIDMIMSDNMIQKISKDSTINNTDALKNVWPGSERFADEVLRMIQKVDWKYFIRNEQSNITTLWRKASRAAAQRGRAQMAQARKELMLVRQAEKAALRAEKEAEKAAKKGALRGRGHGSKNKGACGHGSSTGGNHGHRPLEGIDGSLNLPGMGVFSLHDGLSPYTPLHAPSSDSVMHTPVHGIILDLQKHSPSRSGPNTPNVPATYAIQRTDSMDSNPFLAPSNSSSLAWRGTNLYFRTDCH